MCVLWFVAELVMLLEWWSGTECTIYTDPRSSPHYGKENAIVVLNHKFEIDFLCGWSLAERLGILGVSGLGLFPSCFSPRLPCNLPFALSHSELLESAGFVVVVVVFI